MTNVVYLGNFKPTPAQEAKINAFVQSQPKDALLELRVYPNFSASVEDDLPTGMAAIFSPDAKVDPSIISDSLFQVFAVNKVRGTHTDAHFESRAEDVNATIADLNKADSVNLSARKTKNNKDVEVWHASIGPGAFLKVFSKIHDNHKTKDYFIAGRATVGQAVQDVKDMVLQKKPTFRQLLRSDEWTNVLHWTSNASRRNLCRAMVQLAEACEVAINRMPDVHAKPAHADAAVPEMAIPDWEHTTHNLVETAYNGKPAVMLTYGVVPSQECARAEEQKHFLVAADAREIPIYRMTKHQLVMASVAVPADMPENRKSLKHFGWNPKHHSEKLVVVL
jgi:hypothetical protein